MIQSQTTKWFGPDRYQRWNLRGGKVPIASKRNFFQRIDKMEAMSVPALQRYLDLFYSKGLIVADLIFLQRLGVKMNDRLTRMDVAMPEKTITTKLNTDEMLELVLENQLILLWVTRFNRTREERDNTLMEAQVKKTRDALSRQKGEKVQWP